MGSGCNRDTGLRSGLALSFFFCLFVLFCLFGLIWLLALKIIHEGQLSDKTGNQGPSPEKQEERD